MPLNGLLSTGGGGSARPPLFVFGLPLLAAAMTILPSKTSSSSSSDTSFMSWLSLFSILDNLFHHWIPNGYLPLYTWSVVFYLGARYYYDATAPSESNVTAQVLSRATAQTTQLPSEASEPQPIDLSGVYKLISNNNFQKLLEAQGVPWFLVKAADKARPTHNIQHQGNSLQIQIQGIIESETHYIIGGQPVETNIRGRLFQDQVTYMKHCESIMDQSDENKSLDNTIVGVQTHKKAIDDGYTVLVQRRHVKEKKQIIMTSRVLFDNDPDGTKTVTCTQIFQIET